MTALLSNTINGRRKVEVAVKALLQPGWRIYCIVSTQDVTIELSRRGGASIEVVEPLNGRTAEEYAKSAVAKARRLCAALRTND